MEPRDLYGLPLDRFVAERGRLAKSLRASGDREQAAEVAGRRKPSVAAWAVNQLVRTQRGAVTSLFEAGDALRDAQSELIAGRGEASLLRGATDDERAAVDALVDAAGGLLSSEGHELSQATLDRVSETLNAAALDEDARAQVRDGCLERELHHAGLGTIGAASAPAPRTRPQPRGRAPSAEPSDAPRSDIARAERERTERRRAARVAEADARRGAERAARELEKAKDRRDRAAGSLREAEDALAKARERAREAGRAHRGAQQALKRA